MDELYFDTMRFNVPPKSVTIVDSQLRIQFEDTVIWMPLDEKSKDEFREAFKGG